MRFRHVVTAVAVASALLGASAVQAGATADSWQIQLTQTIPGQTDQTLSAVACASSTVCQAVGTYGGSMWTEAFVGGHWGQADRLSASGSDYHSLGGIACPSTECFAVGFSGSATEEAFVDREVNGRWTAGNPTSGGAAIDARLNGVSCSSIDACTAVGYDVTTGEALIERWNGTAWTEQHSAPAVAFLDAVSCPAADSCEVSGSYGAQPELPLVEHWNGTTWKQQSAPTQSGAESSELDGVSCTSATFCLAVGLWSPSSAASGIHVLLDRYNGTGWTRLTDPSGSDEAGLASVSCVGPSICSAVGAAGPNGSYKVLAERWDGTSWEYRTSQDSGAASGLSSVSCVPGVCRGVGDTITSDTDGETLPLAEAN